MNPRAFWDELQAIARPTGSRSRRDLHEGDFLAGTPTAGQLSQVLYYRVPPGRMAFLDADKPIRMVLRGKATFTAAGATPETFDLKTAGFTAIANPSGMTSVIVLKNGTEVTPTAINYSAATVSLNTVAADAIVVYALPVAGQVQCRVVPPSNGASGVFTPFLSKTVASLNTVPQADAEYAPRIKFGWPEVPIVPLGRLEVWADCGVAIAPGDSHTAEIHFPAEIIGVNPASVSELADAVHRAFF